MPGRHATTSTRPRPTPVKICAFSHELFDLQCQGFLSINHRAWYSSPLCYQLQRLMNGEPRTREQLRVLCDTRHNHSPAEKVLAQYEKTEEMIAAKQIREVIDPAIRGEISE